jgi:hypothetical protein
MYVRNEINCTEESDTCFLAQITAAAVEMRYAGRNISQIKHSATV